MTKKIVILEPYEGVRESFSLILEDYNLFHASDSAALFKVLEHLEDPDMVIIDVDSIFEPLDTIKQIAKRKDLKIILIAGDFSLEFQEAVVRISGDIRYWQKPFASELLDYVQKILGDRPGRPESNFLRTVIDRISPQ